MEAKKNDDWLSWAAMVLGILMLLAGLALSLKLM
jgi:hypothetical protein